MAEVDLLEVVQVPLPEHVLVDPQQVVEGEVQHLRVELLNFDIDTTTTIEYGMEKEDLYLRGGVQLRDPGERGVEALHRLLAPLPLAGAVLGAVAQGRGLLNTEFINGMRIMQTELHRLKQRHSA